jgi:glycosyltransferase involved in cell wall biosynthesis
VDVIIPAFNEENAVGNVLQEIPTDHVREVIVVNNNSNDQTRQRAIEQGATVLDEPRQGYGYACLKGIAHLKAKTTPPDVVVFLDADYSDYPEELSLLVDALVTQDVDMAIGSRALGNRQRGSMTPQQIFGNWLATTLIRWLYGVRYTDLGPFRAIRYDTLLRLGMQDTTYGWTVEMQLKAAKMGYRVTEVPVRYKVRIGHSKVSGTLKGTLLAGYKILGWIFKYYRTPV